MKLLLNQTKALFSAIFLTIFLHSVNDCAAKDEYFSLNVPYAMLIDHETGVILYDHNGDEQMFPASMTKVMTSYIVFDALRNQELSLEDKVFVTQKAASTSGSKTFIRSGSKVTVGDLLRGLIIQSGNDAAVAIAEAIGGGDEQSFVNRMNYAAAKLNMAGTIFKNASGLPANGHVSTCRDLLKLSKSMIAEYPEYYGLYAEKEFSYDKIKQPNRNYLLGDGGVDGIKTGYTDQSKYSIVVSAQLDGRRLIGVINGAKTERERGDIARSLLRHGFANFAIDKLYDAGDVVVKTSVLYGQCDVAEAVIENDVSVVRRKYPKSEWIGDVKVKVKSNIKAPIFKGDRIGEIVIKRPMLNGDEEIIPLLAKEDVKAAGFFKRIIDNIEIMMTRR